MGRVLRDRKTNMAVEFPFLGTKGIGNVQRRFAARYPVRETCDHPFPKTTLAKLLFQQVVQQPGLAGAKEFSEALLLCKSVFQREKQGSRRVSKAPYYVFFGGVRAYLENGGSVSGKQADQIERVCNDSYEAFPHEKSMADFSSRIRRLLSKPNPEDGDHSE